MVHEKSENIWDGPQGVAYAQRLGPNTVYILAGEERKELLLHLKLDRFLIKDAPGPCTEPVGRRPGTGPTPFPGLSARNITPLLRFVSVRRRWDQGGTNYVRRGRCLFLVFTSG